MGIQSIEMYAFSYFSDRAVDMGLIGKTCSSEYPYFPTPPPPTTKRNRKSRGSRSQFKSKPNWNFHRLGDHRTIMKGSMQESPQGFLVIFESALKVLNFGTSLFFSSQALLGMFSH